MYGNFSMMCAASASRASSLPVHPKITLGSCVPAQPGPCSHSDVTLTDSPPDNSIHAPPASCQSQRPSWGYWRSCQPVWDVSVKAHPLCHSVSLPGQPDVRLLSSFHLSFLSTSISFFLWQSVCLLPGSHQGYDSPLIPDPITDSLDTHLSSLHPLVFVMECFTNTSTDLIYMFLFLSPVSVLLNATMLFLLPLRFSHCHPPPVLIHPSSLTPTVDKVWASSWLENRTPVIPVNTVLRLCQSGSGQNSQSSDLTKVTEFLWQDEGKLLKFCNLCPSNSPLDMDHPWSLILSNLLIKHSFP